MAMHVLENDFLKVAVADVQCGHLPSAACPFPKKSLQGKKIREGQDV